MTYTEREGTCGDIQEEIVRLGSGTGSGSDDECTGTSTVSDDACTVEVESTCDVFNPATGDFIGTRMLVATTTVLDASASQLKSIAEIRLSLASGGICRSTYDMAWVRLSGGSGGTQGNAGTGGNECQPDCADRECGTDPVCGVSCGSCATGRECSGGVCISAEPLLENGALCAVDADCSSGYCGENLVGEAHCYGSGGPNDVCGDSFDCNGGLCVPLVAGDASSVCVPGVVVCDDLGVYGSCTMDLAIASCQLRQYCGEDVTSDFDDCVAFSCDYWYDNPPSTGCASQLDYTLYSATCN